MIEQTEAIVLDGRRFSESSKIVTLYTRSRGIIAVMAKGAMRLKSPLGGFLDPLSFIGVTLRIKEGRQIQLITSAETVERFRVLSRDFDRISAGLEIIELVRATISEPEANHALFEAILRSLRALDDPQINPRVVALRFQLALIDILGYALRLDGCGVCDDPVEASDRGISFGIEAGSPLCAAHSDTEGSFLLSNSALEALRLLTTAKFFRLSEYQFDPGGVADLHGLLGRFLQYHIPGLRRLKVGDVISRMGGEAS